MNSKLAIPGIGGAAAVLIAWYVESHYGTKPSAEQVAAIATMVSAAAGYTDEILEALKAGIVRLFEKSPAVTSAATATTEGEPK